MSLTTPNNSIKNNELNRNPVKSKGLTGFTLSGFPNINNVKDYSDFVNDAVDNFAGKDKKSRLFKLINSANHMESDDRVKIYYLTKVLMEIKDSHWIKKNVVHQFCNKEKR